MPISTISAKIKVSQKVYQNDAKVAKIGLEQGTSTSLKKVKVNWEQAGFQKWKLNQAPPVQTVSKQQCALETDRYYL